MLVPSARLSWYSHNIPRPGGGSKSLRTRYVHMLGAARVQIKGVGADILLVWPGHCPVDHTNLAEIRVVGVKNDPQLIVRLGCYTLDARQHVQSLPQWFNLMRQLATHGQLPIGQQI